MTPRFLLRLVSALVLCSAFGCGLAEYEDKMRDSQKKAARFDEEILLLDEPAQIHTRKYIDKDSKLEVEVPDVDLFMPLPRGITGKFTLLQIKNLLWQYPRKQMATTSATGQPPPAPAPGQPGTPASAPTTEFLEVDLAWSTDPNREQFIDIVLNQFSYQRKWKTTEQKEKVPGLIWKAAPPGRMPIDYETFEFYDPKNNYCSVSFRSWEAPKETGTGKDYLNVAVCFKVERKQQAPGTPDAPVSPKAIKTITYCLDWLAIKEEKGRVEAEYRKRIPAKAPPQPAPPASQTPTPPGG
jgi:hypothetical protein